MSGKLVFGLFVVLAAVQIAVPATMIVQHETVLREGRVYKFKTAPVDPADAFRGRYVALRLEEDTGPGAADVHWQAKQHAFAELVEDSQGFAHIRLITAQKPQGADYIKVRVLYGEGPRVTVAIPIDRYYMNEAAAPKAEMAYREHSRFGQHNAYVTVRVLNGDAVIDGLYVDGVRIEDFIRKSQGTKNEE